MTYELCHVIYVILRKFKRAIASSINLYVVSMSRSYVKLISPLIFISLIIVSIDTCKKTTFIGFHLAVKIDRS